MSGTAASRALCRQLGLAHPIILAPMGGGPATPELVAAVADAGGLGSIAAGYLSPDALGDALAATRAATDGAVAVNIFVPPQRPLGVDIPSDVAATVERLGDDIGAPPPAASLPDPATFEAQVDIAAASDVVLVSFTFGLPTPEMIEQLHEAGKTVAATANTFADAVRVAEAGCDAVIVQGFEAGAHRGGLSERGDQHVGLFSLLEQTRALDIPVVASGGITSGAGVAACLALGGAAAQIGTAFLVTDESGATPEWKKAVTASVDADTVITGALTGRGARGVRNPLVDALAEVDADRVDYPVLNNYTTKLRGRAKELGDPDFQSLWTGQSGAATRPGSARAVMDLLVSELAEAAAGLNGD